MPRKGGNPAVLRDIREKTLAATIADYRRWVCGNLGGLLAGNTASWKEFSKRRESLRNAGPVTRRLFEWEQGFLEETVRRQTVSRSAMCRIGRVSPAALRSYEKLGLLGDSPQNRTSCGAEDLKRLQWVLFFLREVRVPVSSLSLLLSFKSIHLGVVALCRSATANRPVHRSPPSREVGPGSGDADGTAAGAKARRDMFHELGNRFHVIGGRANLLRRKMAENPEAERNLAIILAQLASAEGILQDLRRTLGPNENLKEDDRADG